jgi:hypothetical protein
MAHVGSTRCPCCGETAAVSHTSTGNRNVRCPHCGFSGYTGPGSRAARLIDAATKRVDQDEPTGAHQAPGNNTEPPVTAPPPAAARSSGVLLAR